MQKELPSALSIDDAVSLLINLPYRPGTTGVLEMLAYFGEEGKSNFDNAKSQEEAARYKALIPLQATRELMARSLYGALETELSAITKGHESLLELEDHTVGSERLTTASVCAWAEYNGFHIEGWETPRHWRKKSVRSYSSDYLDMLDDVIATFCEEGGEGYSKGRSPKNEAVITYIKGKYGEEVSEKIITSMATIVRQGTSPSTKK